MQRRGIPLKISHWSFVIGLFILCFAGIYLGSTLLGANVHSDDLAPWSAQANAATPFRTATPRLNPRQTERAAPAALATTTSMTTTKRTPQSRGYLTTPQELAVIRQKADQGIQPYAGAVEIVLDWARKEWKFNFRENEVCKDADKPAWIDDTGGTPILYAKALAYHLTEKSVYAEEVARILQQIMTEVKTIRLDDPQCRLNFGRSAPEMVAAADLIELYWQDRSCTGPTSTFFTETDIGTGKCKALFQNWLVKNPYYVVSYAAALNKSNWGAATTTATAYIADYLWDRSDVLLLHRHPAEMNDGAELPLTPAEAYAYANQLMFDRMNGYAVENGSSSSCDYLGGAQQNDKWPPVKSQITENGIIPEDARREEYCNVPKYNGTYQNYPQGHLGHNIQQCELLLRRGDPSCYENVDNTDIPEYPFLGPDGVIRYTHLYPGRGSIERAIKAIIVDSKTEWRHESALEVAYRYYYRHHRLPGFEQWAVHLKRPAAFFHSDIGFGTLTHGFAAGETPAPPPTVPPP